MSIYSSLLMGMMIGIWMLLQAGLRYYRTGEVHQRVLQEAAVAMRKIAQELGNSTPPSVQIPMPGAVIFLSADAPYPAGAGNWTYGSPPTTLVYQKWVSFYRDTATNTLVRTEDATQPGLPTTALPIVGTPTAPTLTVMQAILAPRRSVLARSVTGLTIALDPPNRLVIDLTASEETGSRTGQTTNVNLHTRVFLGN